MVVDYIFDRAHVCLGPRSWEDDLRTYSGFVGDFGMPTVVPPSEVRAADIFALETILKRVSNSGAERSLDAGPK